jgi:5-methylcytosine-specific restriction endonuclease McrA
MRKAKLSTLPPMVATLTPRLGYSTEKERNDARVGSEPWRRWYRTKRWGSLRQQVLVRDLWTCQVCRRIITEKGAAHCDHVKPHRGNAQAFWAGPFQCLCVECHTKKSIDERKM